MQETVWEPLPYPFALVATPHALPRLDAADILERLLEDAAGAAGTLAVAMTRPEAEQDALRYAARLLAEHLKATLALWYQWQGQEAPEPG